MGVALPQITSALQTITTTASALQAITTSTMVSTLKSSKTLSKSSGKMTPKRHRRPLNSHLVDMPKQALKRLAYRAGILRIGATVFPHCRDVMKEFMARVLRDALLLTQHAGRKTVSCEDIKNALARQGVILYGYDKPY